MWTALTSSSVSLQDLGGGEGGGGGRGRESVLLHVCVSPPSPSLILCRSYRCLLWPVTHRKPVGKHEHFHIHTGLPNCHLWTAQQLSVRVNFQNSILKPVNITNQYITWEFLVKTSRKFCIHNPVQIWLRFSAGDGKVAPLKGFHSASALLCYVYVWKRPRQAHAIAPKCSLYLP